MRGTPIRPSQTGKTIPIAASDLTGGYSKQAIIRDISLTLHDSEWLTLIGAQRIREIDAAALAESFASPSTGPGVSGGRLP